jgi:hypothetical protein
MERESRTYAHRLAGECKCGVTHTPGNIEVEDPEAIYDYVDEAGTLLFQVVRFPGKRFRQRRPGPDASEPWVWNLNGVRRVLYRLPEVIAAVQAGDTIYVVEGEKDVEAIRDLDLVAT